MYVCNQVSDVTWHRHIRLHSITPFSQTIINVNLSMLISCPVSVSGLLCLASQFWSSSLIMILKLLSNCCHVLYTEFRLQTSKSYSKNEVTLHNTRTDCWIIIKNKVWMSYFIGFLSKLLFSIKSYIGYFIC